MKSLTYQANVARQTDTRRMAVELAKKLKRLTQAALAIGYTLEQLMDLDV